MIMMVMDYLKPFFLISLAFSLSGCAKFNDLFGRIDKNGRTTVSVGTQHSRGNGILQPLTCTAGVPCLPGGVMVYAVRDDGLKESAMIGNETQALSMSLLNGNYTFYAFGWDSGSLQTSFTHCGTVGPIALNGTATDVTMAMGQAACSATTSFAPSYAFGTGSPPNILPLTVGFCGRYANVLGMNAGSNCPGGFESSMIFKGNSTSAVGDGDYVSASNTVVFAAAVSNASLPELFATNMSTNLQRKLSYAFPTSPTPVGVNQVIAIPGTTRFLFTADQITGALPELFMFDLATNTTTKISHVTPVAASHGVQAVRIGMLNSKPYAIFAGDMQTVGLYELYSVDVSTTTPPAPVKISGTMVGGAAGIYNCTACMAGGWESWRFDISTNVHPDGYDNRTVNTLNPYVIYVADQVTFGSKAVFIASLDGSPLPGSTPTGTKISGTEIATASDFADMFSFSYDAQYVAYHAHQSTSFDGIYSVKFNPAAAPGPAVAICPVSTCGAKVPFLMMANTMEKMAYVTAGTFPTLSIVDLTNQFGMNFQVLQATGGANETGITRLKFTPDDNWVVAATTDGSGNVHFLRSVSTSPTANLIGVTTEVLANPASGTIRSTKPPSSGEYFNISPDSTKVLYAADQNTVGNVELFYAPVNAGASSVAISGTVASPSNSVVSYTFLGSTPYFAAALNTPGFNELYSTALTPSPTPVRLNSGPVAGSIQNMLNGNPLTNVVMYNAAPPTSLGGTNKEMYMYNVTTGVHSRISKQYGGVTGIGRFQITALTYGQAYTSGATYNNAFQSSCMGPGSSLDGMSIPTSARVPLGSGTGDSPFAYAVDLYPQATSCSGTVIRYVFPAGLANFGSSPSAAYLNVAGDGAANLSVFVKDF